MKAAVIGATGAVGQRFVSLLSRHPKYKVSEVVASERSAGKRFGDAANWVLDEAMPEGVAGMEVKLARHDLDADVVFSAIPGGLAGKEERSLAERGYKVFSNAKDHRMSPDVPLMVAEINPGHAALVDRQATPGFVVTNPNCTTIVLTMALKPLLDAFGIEQVMAVSMQALSGAGYPGVPSLDIQGNVVPYIGGEEDKVETEPGKILGDLGPDGIRPAPFPVSATCTRVPVAEGHTIAVMAKFAREPGSMDEVIAAWEDWRGEPQKRLLPSAPRQPVHYHRSAHRPQPRRDWPLEGGMAVSVGRLRPEPLFGERGVKFVCTGSNTVRGAAGASILNAELFEALGRM